MHRLRVGPAARAALALVLALGLVLVPATATAAARQDPGTDRLLVPAAGWHGRAIQQPHGHDAVRAASPSAPPGWSAGAVSLGSGYDRAEGSRRVRELQRRLRRLGYHAGPVDGRFGPRTRAAVAWFQRKHGLPLDGRADLSTVRHLRARTGAAPSTAPAPATPAAPDAGAPATDAAPEPEPGTTLSRDAPDPTGDEAGIPWWALASAVLALLGLSLLAVEAVLLARARRRRPASRRVVPPAPAPVPSAAIGYVRLARGAPSASFHAQAAAIEAGCLVRGLELVGLVSDVEPNRPAEDPPPALAYALGRLGDREVGRLVVSRLDHLAASQEEARNVLHAVSQRGGGLVVLDRDLDTVALDEPEALDRLLVDVRAVRTRPRAPEQLRPVDAHIASMREEGLEPGVIAAALNAEPVAPPRGSLWGSSSVEEALRRRGADAARTEARHV